MTEEISNLRPQSFKGGILADSMGLGKSLSVISLLATAWGQCNTEPQATLFVVPLSLIVTWEQELIKHLHPHTLQYCVYNGPKRHQNITVMYASDIVITTYDIVALEWRNLENGRTPLFAKDWSRIVLDEGESPYISTHGYTS